MWRKIEGGGKASCSQKGREAHRCCWWGGPEGPGRKAAHLDWPILEAAVDKKKISFSEWSLDYTI